jgi:hypothetical protein
MPVCLIMLVLLAVCLLMLVLLAVCLMLLLLLLAVCRLVLLLLLLLLLMRVRAADRPCLKPVHPKWAESVVARVPNADAARTGARARARARMVEGVDAVAAVAAADGVRPSAGEPLFHTAPTNQPRVTNI